MINADIYKTHTPSTLIILDGYHSHHKDMSFEKRITSTVPLHLTYVFMIKTKQKKLVHSTFYYSIYIPHFNGMGGHQIATHNWNGSASNGQTKVEHGWYI